MVPQKSPICWVVWNMNFIFIFILGIIIPTKYIIPFKGIETTNQKCFFGVYIELLELIQLIPLSRSPSTLARFPGGASHLVNGSYPQLYIYIYI